MWAVATCDECDYVTENVLMFPFLPETICAQIQRNFTTMRWSISYISRPSATNQCTCELLQWLPSALLLARLLVSHFCGSNLHYLFSFVLRRYILHRQFGNRNYSSPCVIRQRLMHSLSRWSFSSIITSPWSFAFCIVSRFVIASLREFTNPE